jgi:cell envelope opacity-associated protein A
VLFEVSALTPEIQDPMGMTRRGVSARTILSRRDFGLNWNKVVEAGPVVGDEVKVEIDAELVKDAAAPAVEQASQKRAPEEKPARAK